MAMTKSIPSTPSSVPKPHRHALSMVVSSWSKAGIRTKILLPLTLLMILSLIGSTVGFIISTNTTRNSILDRQLEEEARRFSASLALREKTVKESAQLIAGSPEVVDTLSKRYETNESDLDNLLTMDDRVVRAQERFRLDQILVFDATGQTRTNIAPSHLEPLSFTIQDALPCQTQSQIALIETELNQTDVHLLIGCAPVIGSMERTGTDELIGIVYTVQALNGILNDIKRDLELASTVSLHDQPEKLVTSASSENGQRLHQEPITIGETPLVATLLLNEQDINEIVGSGFRFMLISSGLTLLLLMAVAAWLAQGLTRPIVHLSAVAQAVAHGDLSRRANLNDEDEIGKLGGAFDQATTTITTLLDQQARTAGELQAILQSMTDGVLAVDLEQRIVMVNPAAAALLGQDQARLVGQHVSAIIIDDESVSAIGLQQIVKHIQTKLGNSQDEQAPEERISLGFRIVRLQSASTLGSGDRQTGAVMVLQDITEAVEADRSKSEFIAIASHELRTPLSGIKGFVDILQMSSNANFTADQQMFMDTIKRQTDNLVQLVNDLLETARLEQGIRTERRWVSLNGAIDEALHQVEHLATNRQIQINQFIEPDLPPVWIDPMHLQRILINIFSNGCKYVYHGGHVSIRAYELYDIRYLPSSPNGQPWSYKDERSVVIEVEDNGVGIRVEDQPNIFTRFFRSENPLSVEVGGTGLGLALTRELVHANKGQIGFRSEELKGSCFWVRLPAPTTDPVGTGSSTRATVV
ncbi:MAG: PAS domain-containing protein [Chloroflexaceae bacterium]|nr:PAS domain-containing protein [Chloroflexaceae bacterium]